MNPSFTPISFESGDRYSNGRVSVYGAVNGEYFHFTEGTYFVFVAKGMVWYNAYTPLKAGMYGCFTGGSIHVELWSKALIIQDRKYDGMRMFGGPLERVGRLKYIDGNGNR